MGGKSGGGGDTKVINEPWKYAQPFFVGQGNLPGYIGMPLSMNQGAQNYMWSLGMGALPTGMGPLTQGHPMEGAWGAGQPNIGWNTQYNLPSTPGIPGGGAPVKPYENVPLHAPVPGVPWMGHAGMSNLGPNFWNAGGFPAWVPGGTRQPIGQDPIGLPWMGMGGGQNLPWLGQHSSGYRPVPGQPNQPTPAPAPAPTATAPAPTATAPAPAPAPTATPPAPAPSGRNAAYWGLEPGKLSNLPSYQQPGGLTFNNQGQVTGGPGYGEWQRARGNAQLGPAFGGQTPEQNAMTLGRAMLTQRGYGDPRIAQEAYNYATKMGYTPQQVDQMMGLRPGQSQEWLKSQGLA